ncbi:hypothetical protein M885DRAFT_217247 [Pelagophyceae sp. CCMP2097]|nr:hypothetical protein M885DRAFT_217247 [Pelagophyceae sp. CCMP2097]
MAALARVGAEAPFGAVAAVDARSAAAGAVLAARFDRGGVAHAQVEGVSRFLVFDSLHHPSLYAYPDAHPLRNYSRLDLQRPDIDAFPLAAMLRGLEVELGPGDVLLLPRGWWRHEECVSSGGALRNEALVVRFATHDDVYQSQDGVLDGADLALAAAKVEREVLAVLGSPARVERCLRDLRSDVVRSGCDCEDPARDADAALCDVEPETSEVDGALLRACVRDARYALGEVVGVDAVEPFVLRYLSAARWKGLAFKASPHDDDGALSSQSSAQAGITRTRLDTAPDAGEDASDDAWDDDDSDGELPIVHDVTDAHL